MDELVLCSLAGTGGSEPGTHQWEAQHVPTWLNPSLPPLVKGRGIGSWAQGSIKHSCTPSSSLKTLSGSKISKLPFL